VASVVAIVFLTVMILTSSSAWSGGFRGTRGPVGGAWATRSPGSQSTTSSARGTLRPSFPASRIVIPQSANSRLHHHGTLLRFIGANWLFSIGTFPPFVYYRPNHFRHFGTFTEHRSIIITELPGAVSVWTSPGTVYFPYQQFAPAPVLPGGLPERSLQQIAPFDPTPTDVVERMLMLAALKKDDVVYDLGAGDGRVVIAAARKYGVKAVGFEIDAGLVKLAREQVKKENLHNLVEIRQQDFLTADLSGASVVTLYLSYDGNAIVKPLLRSQLNPGARVVSYTFDMGDWQPKIAETYRDNAGNAHALYLWEITAPALYSDSSQSQADVR
jgi:SAM-dependent methyltransferase